MEQACLFEENGGVSREAIPIAQMLCSVDRCSRHVHTKGYCNAHYQRLMSGRDMDKPVRFRGKPGRTCSIDGCDRKHSGRGYCDMHLLRDLKGRDMYAPVQEKIRRGISICSIDGCGRTHKARGYCAGHASRIKKYGDPLAHKPLVSQHIHYPCGISGAHGRIRKMWGSATRYQCIQCDNGARDWAYDGTDPTELLGPSTPSNGGVSTSYYSLYPEFYMPMCPGCHSKRDGAVQRTELREYRTLKHLSGLSFDEIAIKLGIKDSLDV